jgi:integrase
VAKKLAKALSDREGGLIFDAEGLKLREYLARWLEGSVKDTVRNTTYERYEQIARTHIIPMLGDVKLKDLSPTHVRGLYKEKLQTLSPRTVQYIHVTLHKALKQAVNDGLVPRNATEAVKPPQVRRCCSRRTSTPRSSRRCLGHSNIAITLDTYSHVLPNMQDSAARALEEALR